jgi:quercetin dioxygenase-like cupin family protein
MQFDMGTNLDRIRELTENVVPFSSTSVIKGDEIFMTMGKGCAAGHSVFKEKDGAILVIDVEAGSLHQCHFHAEREIVIVLNGSIEVITSKYIKFINQYEYVVFEPMEHHTMQYHEATKVIAITIPSSEDFPDAAR